MLNKFFSFIICASLFFSVIGSAQAQSDSSYPQYIIQPNDNLGTIADRFGVTPEEIIQLNNIQNPDLLSPGQMILIPGLEGVSGILTTITVQVGESLNSLSAAYQIAQDQIIRLNHITSPSEVMAGTKLLVTLSEESKVNSPCAIVGENETFLESAVLCNQNPWGLSLSNNTNHPFISLAGRAYYKNLLEGESPSGLIDQALNSVTISPLPLVQGETFTIRVNSNSPVSLQGELAGNTLHFFSQEDNHYLALQGIHAMADPGIYTFKLTGTLSDGSNFEFEQPILLVSGDYPNDPPLTVDAATIDPLVTEPELELVKNLIDESNPTRYWSGIFQSPGEYNEYNSLFGVRRSYNDSPYDTFHTGLDFAGGVGLPIYAPADGVVVFAGPLTVRGNATFIDHGWGVYSGYFHQSEIKVKVGDKVTKGQIIGLVGNTGRVDGANEYEGAGAHLHWEIWVNGVQVNPYYWLLQEYP